MRFTDHLWNQAYPLYNKILQQPFIRELAKGTLSKEIFKHYMAQDSLYLLDYARALSMLSAKSVKTEDIFRRRIFCFGRSDVTNYGRNSDECFSRMPQRNGKSLYHIH